MYDPKFEFGLPDDCWYLALNHDPIRTGEDFDDGAVIEQGGNDGNY